MSAELREEIAKHGILQWINMNPTSSLRFDAFLNHLSFKVNCFLEKMFLKNSKTNILQAV
jgi:hypothetical protein